MPTIGTQQIKLLERLCNAVAVSGDEGEVRRIVLDEIKGHAGEIRVDALGNVLAIKQGSGRKRLRVMLSAHMDEVGFMLVTDEGEGLFRFESIGGIDVRQLPGKAVLIGKEHVPGVIGARPIHLTSAEERKQKVSLEAMRIDTGPGNSKVKPGDRATFATRFQRNGPSLMAKALDDRLGVVTLIELVKHAPAGIDLPLPSRRRSARAGPKWPPTPSTPISGSPWTPPPLMTCQCGMARRTAATTPGSVSARPSTWPII